jgi:hypothetical protein
MDFFVGLILFISLFKVGNDDVVVDTFDMIEVNHYHNEWGVQTWSQVVLWDWYSSDSKFHCEKWIMMTDAYEKTKEGEKRWEIARRQIEQTLETLERREQWMWASEYKGDYVNSKFLPKKNWTTGYYEIKYNDKKIRRIIRAKIFRETHTQFDPEVKDRKFHPTSKRRGLTLPQVKTIEDIIDDLRFDTIPGR